jgi:hypothetical protein
MYAPIMSALILGIVAYTFNDTCGKPWIYNQPKQPELPVRRETQSILNMLVVSLSRSILFRTLSLVVLVFVARDNAGLCIFSYCVCVAATNYEQEPNFGITNSPVYSLLHFCLYYDSWFMIHDVCNWLTSLI